MMIDRRILIFAPIDLETKDFLSIHNTLWYPNSFIFRDIFKSKKIFMTKNFAKLHYFWR